MADIISMKDYLERKQNKSESEKTILENIDKDNLSNGLPDYYEDDFLDMDYEQLISVMEMSTDELIEDIVSRIENSISLRPDISSDFVIAELYNRYKGLEYILVQAAEKIKK